MSKRTSSCLGVSNNDQRKRVCSRTDKHIIAASRAISIVEKMAIVRDAVASIGYSLNPLRIKIGVIPHTRSWR